MKVLGIDSATLTAGVAILDDDRVLAEARHDSSHRTNDLLVTIDRLCTQVGLAPTELDAIAVGAGPGSFTALRVGLATAKGIAFAAQRPLWAVSSLAALAMDAGATSGVVVAVLDARRGEVFAGCYRSDGTLLGEERVLAPGALAAFVREACGEGEPRYVGDALAAHPEVLGSLAERWLATTPSGVSVARLALAGAHVDVVVGGAPTYIRPSEAEVKYPDGVPGALKR